MKLNVKVKVCGMRDPENISELIEKVNPDFIGFIYYPGSGRYVNNSIPHTPGVKRVGVFVNEEPTKIQEIADKVALDYIQLHGDEDLDTVRELHNSGFKIIKAIRVGKEVDFAALEELLPYVNYFLFDSDGKYYGGNGIPFEWDLLKNYSLDKPFLVGGGISPENLAEVLKLGHPKFAGVDLNSGFEKGMAEKDIDLIKQTLINNELPG